MNKQAKPIIPHNIVLNAMQSFCVIGYRASDGQVVVFEQEWTDWPTKIQFGGRAWDLGFVDAGSEMRSSLGKVETAGYHCG